MIGTGSPRRAAQLRALGLGLVVEPIRGNVDTRLAAVTGVASTRSCSRPPDCAASVGTTT